MVTFRFALAKENRLLQLKITENLGNIAADTVERYIQTPVESGHPERLIFGIPIGIINGTARAIDGVIAGIADQEIDVPDGSFAETKRDIRLTKDHIIPPKPIKLVTDLIRLPGTLTSGFLDATSGFDHRQKIHHARNQLRNDVHTLSLST